MRQHRFISGADDAGVWINRFEYRDGEYFIGMELSMVRTYFHKDMNHLANGWTARSAFAFTLPFTKCTAQLELSLHLSRTKRRAHASCAK
ncbi:hypothetical protein TC41_1313 [Alicyclobacillus acidocaldarius subsp. acidocaldarius Tc-4-1]|uniref:Uncharacterized protein n=1 Tax=Alicyclobacillus acidocaldarius (strain Tc-4-1) TaxID=1048834 RepID=F8IHW2_ALIAT|nr:hypothetical protein TC41_1313 [Alicyclobacillus acidocaldarius subsp. acidocaldarius Tc-4-1]